jgi:hypothetical protein
MSKEFRILYKFASRNRPSSFFEVLDKIFELSTLPPSRFLIVASLDVDDHLMNVPSVTERLKDYPSLKVNWGTSRSKVAAINRDLIYYRAWDILVNVSDDMLFLKKGFDQQICADMERYFLDLDGVLHYPDGNVRDLMTLSIMGVRYYHRFDYIYYPGYKSLWCDNEATEVARLLGKYQFVDEQLFEHRHPAFGFRVMDSQYHKTESYYELDKAVFERRKKFKFGFFK